MKHVSIILLLIGMLACAINCSDNTGIVDPDESVQEPFEVTYSLFGAEFGLDDLDYDTVSGRLSDPDASAILTGEFWAGRQGVCTFALQIPQGAVPPSEYPVDFSMSVPTRDCYMEYEGTSMELPLIVRLLPDGMQFNVPVTIMATWMPWRFLPTEDRLRYWYYLPDGGESELYIDLEVVEIPGGHDQVHFSVDHFSDWGLGPEGLTGGGHGHDMFPQEN